MKRGILAAGVLALFAMIFVMLSSGVASAASCNPIVSLVNQEPYPAVPGDYVKLVFQVSGLDDSNCNYLTFELVPKYPISFDPGTDSKVTLRGGTYSGADYGSYILIPYKVRIDSNALEGDNPIEVKYSTSAVPGSSVSSNFDIAINNTLTDFSVFVKDFNFGTNQITIELLNIGKSDVQAMAVELQPQKNFTIKGPNVYIVGSLDSNDYTTATFEVSPNKGNVNMSIYYNDVTGVRRSTSKEVYFDPDAFANRKTAASSNSTGLIVTIVIVLLIVAYIFYRRHKKKKKRKLLMRG